MPFTMIHLHVAMRAAGSKTEKKEEFLLGSIAPDAVHYLPDYTSSYKCRSHLLPDGIPWGTCEGRNNELWEENIRKFCSTMGRGGGEGFYPGICSPFIDGSF